jgi:carbon monoxide dehydrogenase subunit G
MKSKCLTTAIALVLAAGSARADFSYEQTSKMTGGMMAGMMKFAGAFSKQAREPMRATVSVKGDRMSTMSGNRLTIIDLSAETMTDVDLEKKTYAVITFADFGRAMQRMSEKMGSKEQRGRSMASKPKKPF